MKFVNIIINRLAGFDIIKSIDDFKISLQNSQEENILLKQKNRELQEKSERKGRKIIYLEQENSSLKEQVNFQKENLILIEETSRVKQRQIVDLEIEIKSLQQEITRFEQNGKIEINRNNKLKEVLSIYKGKIEELTKELSANEQIITNLTVKNNTLEVQNSNKENCILNYAKKIENLIIELNSLKDECERLNNECSNIALLKDDLIVLLSDKEELLQIKEKISNENESLKVANTTLTNQLESLERNIVENSSEIRKLESIIQNNEETIQIKKREIEILQIDKAENKKRFDEVCKKLSIVESEKGILLEKLHNLEKACNIRNDEFNVLSSICDYLRSKIAYYEEQNQDIKVRLDEKHSVFVENVEEVLPIVNRSNILNIKTKEEEVIEQSGNSIVDFPPIFNDSNKETHRTIEYVYDENGKIVYAKEFFERSAEEIAQVSRKMSEAELSGSGYWTCGLCRHRVKIAHRTYNGKESLFFIHASREHNCDWILKAIKSKDVQMMDGGLLELDDLQVYNGEYKFKSHELKEKIYSLLISPKSVEMGISEVQMDEIIRSKVPYMRWRRPDISFVFNGKKIVIELQKCSHTLDTIVDRDIFFRLNDIQIIWVFGSDSDTSYDYMRKVNYKNTMFDNHRNVFIFDKEAQLVSDEENTLLLKCNWLDYKDDWYFKIGTLGKNGKLVKLNEFTFDDEYCKPYYFDANEEYFLNYPNARDAYMAKKMTREQLMQAIEERWTRDASYEDAQIQMRQRNSKATIYCVKDLWGFRFNTTIIIPPIFTVEPKDLHNGYYLVNQNNNFGIVNYYGEKIIGWDGRIKCDDLNYDDINKHLLFKRDGLWGVADCLGNELISPLYQDVVAWTNTIYKVRNAKWGLCNINNEILSVCQYDRIEKLINGRAIAIKAHPSKPWTTVSGYIDENAHELFSVKKEQKDGFFIVQTFELYGVINENNEVVLPCLYEEILPWANNLYRVKENTKWGIYDVKNQSFLLQIAFDFIGELNNGVAKTMFANLESVIDEQGNEVAQEVILLQNKLKKTKIAGKWGIVNEKGDIIINHQYDEIGSFRSRMIGVINGKLIKLDINYLYPIYMTGKYIKSQGNSHFFDISGIECVITEHSLRLFGKSLNQICDDNICKQLAFANILFSTQNYILRVLKPSHLNKQLAHADGKNDFLLGEIVIGEIKSFKMCKQNGVYKRRKAMIEFEDGRKSMIPRRFFKLDKTIDCYSVGDRINLKKVGFSDELDQTIWEIV